MQLAELHKYTASGTVTYKFSDWTLAESEREAMDIIGSPMNLIDDTVVDLNHPDVYFDSIEDAGKAKRGGRFEDDPGMW